MTNGHKHREVKVRYPFRWYVRLLQKPLVVSRNLPMVDKSPYPWGPMPADEHVELPPAYYLSTLSILHRWTGLTLRFDPPKEK